MYFYFLERYQVLYLFFTGKSIYVKYINKKNLLETIQEGLSDSGEAGAKAPPRDIQFV